jgi:hypothetical protein
MEYRGIQYRVVQGIDGKWKWSFELDGHTGWWRRSERCTSAMATRTSDCQCGALAGHGSFTRKELALFWKDLSCVGSGLQGWTFTAMDEPARFFLALAVAGILILVVAFAATPTARVEDRLKLPDKTLLFRVGGDFLQSIKLPEAQWPRRA